MESAVCTHILNQADDWDYKVYYWRNGNKEIDFVLESNRRCIAIEVKSGRRTANAGMPAFVERFSPQRSLIVGSGGVPVEEFLQWELGKLFQS